MSVTTNVNERLAALTAAGTSVWLDQIRRSLIDGGELERLVREDSLRGVTSNPTIFEKAILGSKDYDSELASMAKEGLEAAEIYDRIAIKDVQLAADVLRPVWEESGHVDGYVSLEVSPRLARDTDGTLEDARRYWKAVDRPNVMIKIPGTDEGLPAIEQAISEGININITLLFSVQAYTRVTEAFLKGLERRRADGGSLDVHSVASFFVSRVDTEVDKRLKDVEGGEELMGLAAVANARAAYQRFKEVFSGERWDALSGGGAPVQRPLWASTGVKNPHYPETKYVDELVAPHTVNTMPMPTLIATAEKSEIRGATADQDPTPDLERLAKAGIDMDDVTDTLLRDGIAAFEKSLDGLLEGVEDKREAIVTDRPPTVASSIPNELEPKIAETVKRAVGEGVARRVWHKDEELWGGPGPEIGNRLGWLTISEAMLDELPDLQAFAQQCRADGLEDVVLLGMGGSSLGPEVIRQSFGEIEGGMRLHVLDSTDPGAILAVQRAIDISKTLFLVSSKSGGTLETLSQFSHFHAEVSDAVGEEQAGSHFVAITDPGSSLVAIAEKHGFRRVFENDPDIGGRYSVLSYFGIVPAVLMGVAVDAVLHRAQIAEQNSTAYDASSSNSGLWLGLIMGSLALQGRDKLTFVVSEPIASFGLWVEQLIAESTGKEGKGILPVADEPLGEPEVYGDDRFFAYLRNADEPDEEADAKIDGAGQGRPADGDLVGPRRARPRADLLLRRVRDRGLGLGAGHQRLRPAQRAGGQGQHREGAQGLHREREPARARRRRRRRSEGAPERGRPTALRGDHGLRPAVARVRRGGCAAAYGPSATARRPPPPSATDRASCIRRASSTREGRPPACSSSCCTTATRTWRFPARRTASAR